MRIHKYYTLHAHTHTMYMHVTHVSCILHTHRSIPKHKDMTVALCYIAHTTQFPQQRAMLDLKLEPPCADIGLLDYHRKEEIMERYVHG